MAEDQRVADATGGPAEGRALLHGAAHVLADAPTDDRLQGALATLAQWRALGAGAPSPVRLLALEALARRTLAHRGTLRQWLEGRLQCLMAAYADGLPPMRSHSGLNGPPASSEAGLRAGLDTLGTTGPAGAGPKQAPAASALQGLVERLAGPGADAPGVPAELKTVHRYRRTLARKRLAQRLIQAEATVPQNAGPLHSHHVVQRALTRLQTLSPDYLTRFMVYADALAWLEQARGAEAPPAAAARSGSPGVATPPANRAGKGRSTRPGTGR